MLHECLAESLDHLDYDEEKATLTFLEDYHTLLLIPLPHRNTHKFYGMGTKADYLAWIEFKGTFTAMDCKGRMTTWSKHTGKTICQNNRAIAKPALGDEESEEMEAENYEVYMANPQDRTWTQHNRVGNVTRSLIVECNGTSALTSNRNFTSQTKQNPFEEPDLFLNAQSGLHFRFKVLEMSVDESFSRKEFFAGKSVSLKFRTAPDSDKY